MPVPQFRKEMDANHALHAEVGRYGLYVMSEFVQSAACNRFHALESRLARWLLMTGDRAHAGSFDTTPTFIATMLGVRRVGISDAAGDLQERGLVKYSRGRMRILDRTGLEKAACICYKQDRAAYKRLCGGGRRRSR